ncbi:hypothetical protein HY995_00055 [Candidatus Micrarchaeota archaeon]|nr:hypothetical protein [Candidatus Micrarchaeota archaeon]
MANVKKYVLFTTPYCVGCKPVKEFLKRATIDGETLDASGEGSEKAVEMGVRSVPTVVLLDERGGEVARASNVSTLRELLSG